MAQATTDKGFNNALPMTPQRWYELLVSAGVTSKDLAQMRQVYMTGPTIFPPQSVDSFLIVLPPGHELLEDEWGQIEELFKRRKTMATYDILKGSTVVGHADVIEDSGQEHPSTLRIGSLVGTRACHQANIDYDLIVDSYDIDWDRLDDDRVLDEQPWGVEPR